MNNWIPYDLPPIAPSAWIQTVHSAPAAWLPNSDGGFAAAFLGIPEWDLQWHTLQCKPLVMHFNLLIWNQFIYKHEPFELNHVFCQQFVRPIRLLHLATKQEVKSVNLVLKIFFAVNYKLLTLSIHRVIFSLESLHFKSFELLGWKLLPEITLAILSGRAIVSTPTN